MMNVRSEGLKLDLVLLKNRVSGLTIDYQSISKSDELQKWLRIIDRMLSDSSPSPEGSIPQILGEATRLPASQPQPSEEPGEEPQDNAEPTMINVRSEGLKLDLVLLKNRVSGLTIDYQNISKSGELRRWIRIVESMISRPVPSPEGSVPQNLSEVAEPLAAQPQPPSKEQGEPPKENQEEHTDEKREESLREEEGQEEPPREEQKGHPDENGYRKVVLRAVDVSLDTLGHDGKQAILSLLENRYGFRESDIPDYPRSFVELLGELLGTSAQNLEKEIISNIRKVWAAPGENLETVVESLKEHLPTTASIETTAEDLQSVAAEAGTAGFRYNATYSRRRN